MKSAGKTFLFSPVPNTAFLLAYGVKERGGDESSLPLMVDVAIIGGCGHVGLPRHDRAVSASAELPACRLCLPAQRMTVLADCLPGFPIKLNHPLVQPDRPGTDLLDKI